VDVESPSQRVSSKRVYGSSRNSYSRIDSSIIYSMVIPSSLETYVIGYTSSFAVHVTALSPGGHVLADASLSTILDNLSDFLVVSATSQSRIVWLTHGVIRSYLLMPHLKENPLTLQGGPYKRLVDVGLADEGVFVAIKRDGSSKVLRLDPYSSAGVKEIWDFAASVRLPHAFIDTSH
jgi:hypothetical protein